MAVNGTILAKEKERGGEREAEQGHSGGDVGVPGEAGDDASDADHQAEQSDRNGHDGARCGTGAAWATSPRVTA